MVLPLGTMLRVPPVSYTLSTWTTPQGVHPAVTNGTTIPDFEFRVVTNTRQVFMFPEGLTFANGLGYSASQGAGTTKGSNLGAAYADLLFVFK